MSIEETPEEYNEIERTMEDIEFSRRAYNFILENIENQSGLRFPRREPSRVEVLENAVREARMRLLMRDEQGALRILDKAGVV